MGDENNIFDLLSGHGDPEWLQRERAMEEAETHVRENFASIAASVREDRERKVLQVEAAVETERHTQKFTETGVEILGAIGQLSKEGQEADEKSFSLSKRNFWVTVVVGLIALLSLVVTYRASDQSMTVQRLERENAEMRVEIEKLKAGKEKALPEQGE